MKREEMEIIRHNVTPAQFCAYVRHMIRKNGLTCVDALDIDLAYWANGGDYEFNYSNIPGKPAQAERSISKPYEMQTYIRNWDGTVYNMIMEFNFWDEKTGTGYFYVLSDMEPKTCENAEKQTETEEAEKTVKTWDEMTEETAENMCTVLHINADTDTIAEEHVNVTWEQMLQIIEKETYETFGPFDYIIVIWNCEGTIYFEQLWPDGTETAWTEY